MIFFFKSDGTLIKSAPETVYQGSVEAGKVYVVAPLNANMLVDVYYELPNGERYGAYLLENNGTVINNEELPDGWALWSTTLESAITQYAGTLKAQFGFYQSGTADKVPLITSQGVTVTIAKGVVRDLPSAPSANVYEQIVNAISSIKQDIANLPNEYLSNTNEDKIALKNNTAIEYSENATAGTIVKRDSDGKINVADGTEDLNAVNLGQFNEALANKVDSSSVSATAVKDTIAQRTSTGQLKAADGVADDDLATVKQLNAVQGNYTDITNIDLNTGDTTVEYDTELGIKVNAKGTLTHKNGATEQPTTKFEFPIVAGAGVSIDKKETEEKVEIKSLNSNLENGTGDVLIQTTDTNQSFKVMKDGRAKVQTAPKDNNDVPRLAELNNKVNISDNFVKVFTIPNGTSTGTLTADVKQKLCNPDGHNYYVFDDTSQMILKYSFNADDEIIQYKAIYLQTDKAYEITMQILPSNGSWRRSQTVLNSATANPTLTEVNLTFGDTTVQYDTTDGIQLNSTARFTDAAGNHDAAMDLALPVVGTDGIVINKAADSEKIEISGNNFVNKPTTPSAESAVTMLANGTVRTKLLDNSKAVPGTIPQYRYTDAGKRKPSDEGVLITNDPTLPYQCANKKYVDNGFVEKITTHTQDNRLYGIHANGTQQVFATSQNVPEVDHIAQYTIGGNIRTNTPIDNLDCANKKYVDDKISALGKLYQHNYTFEAGTGNYVYCTTYKNSNTPMTAAEVINFFKSDPSVGKVVNVCVVSDYSTIGSGYFLDAGEGIDYTVIVLGSSANFIITADTNMTTNIIEL